MRFQLIKTKTITITIHDIREIKHVIDRTSKARTNFIAMITKQIWRKRGGRKNLNFNKKISKFHPFVFLFFFAFRNYSSDILIFRHSNLWFHFRFRCINYVAPTRIFPKGMNYTCQSVLSIIDKIYFYSKITSQHLVILIVEKSILESRFMIQTNNAKRIALNEGN